MFMRLATRRCFAGSWIRRTVCFAAVVTLLAAPAAAAAEDQDPGGSLLANERWREYSYGLSLQPPAGFLRLQPPSEGALVTFVDPGVTTINVLIRRSEKPQNLNTLKQQAIIEFTLGLEEQIIIDDHAIEVGGRPGSVMYLPLVGRGGEKRVFGLGLLRIDPRTVILLRIDMPPDRFKRDKAAFEAMIDSIELADPRDLDRIRTAWIQAGERWHKGVDRAALKQAMREVKWLRIVDPEQRDVGYVRIRQRLANELGIPGIRIDIDSRIVVADETYDTESFFWESDNGEAELWSVRTARRSLRQPRPQVVTETGIRSMGVIKVERKAPGDIDHLEWPTPPTGYLSQVELQLLPALLPRNRQQDFAFYAYHSSAASVTLQTIQIHPLEHGGYIVRIRPAPDREEVITTYDRAGRLVRRQMPDGAVMLPATAQEMRLIWNIR